MNDSGIKFSTDKKEIDPHELRNLFNESAFWAKDREIEDLATAIQFSEPVVWVKDRSSLIGFARATSDGVYRATIWDVVIHPDYQGRGLGRRLLEILLNHPRLARVEKIYLMTTYGQEFYRRCGFAENGSTTMVLLNPRGGSPSGEAKEILSIY